MMRPWNAAGHDAPVDRRPELLDALSPHPALDALEGEPGVHVVGGAVRDALLGRAPHELDFVVEGDALPVARRACCASPATRGAWASPPTPTRTRCWPPPCGTERWARSPGHGWGRSCAC